MGPAHDQVWTETTNKRQDFAGEISGSLGCRGALVDRHGVYIIVMHGCNELFVLHVVGDRGCFSSCQRRHKLTVRDHKIPQPFILRPRKFCALTHRWTAPEYPNSSTRQSPTVSPSPRQLHFHQSDAKPVDAEVKVDALTKLQAELEAGAEVCPQPLIPTRFRPSLQGSRCRGCHQHSQGMSQSLASTLDHRCGLRSPLTLTPDHRKWTTQSSSNSPEVVVQFHLDILYYSVDRCLQPAAGPDSLLDPRRPV